MPGSKQKTNETPQTIELHTKKLSLKDLSSANELTPELLEQIEQKDTGKVIQLLLETPEAKKLTKEIEKLQESCEKSGMKLEDQLIIGNKSLRELADNQTDTANKDSLLKYAVLCVGMANQKKIPSTFVPPAVSEDNVDMSKVSSFGASFQISEYVSENSRSCETASTKSRAGQCQEILSGTTCSRLSESDTGTGKIQRYSARQRTA